MNFDTATLVMSEKGLSRINSPAILEALKELQPYINHDIPAQKLKEILEPKPVNAVEATAFLYQCLNIVDSPISKPYEKVLIVYNDKAQIPALDLIKNETHLKTTTIAADQFDIKITCDKQYFIVLLQSRYDYHSLKSLYFTIASANPKSAVVVGYYTPAYYCVTQPYFFEVGNPCHFCHIDRLLNYETKKNSSNNWTQLLKFSNQHGYEIPCGVQTQLQQSLAMNLLISRINLFTSNSNAKRHQDSALSSTSINLMTGKIDEEIVPHWVLCQCQRSF